MPSRRSFTAEQDAELARVYRNREAGNMSCFARRWGVPKSTVSARARRLGLPPLRRFRGYTALWKEAEDQLLVEHGHRPALDLQRRLAAAGFTRKIKSIQNRRSELKRAGFPVGAYREELTVQEVAEGMGCDDITVLKWIRVLGLKATALCPDSGRAKFYRIRERDLQRFCLDHTAAVARFKPDLVWYTHLINADLK